jgi:hypothetical protein
VEATIVDANIFMICGLDQAKVWNYAKFSKGKRVIKGFNLSHLG